MSPRKSRKKSQPETPATEPTPVAQVLEQSRIAEILASSTLENPATSPPEKPSLPDTDPDMPILEPLSNGKPSHAAKILAERPAFRQVPEEYFRVASHEREGIRVFKNTVMQGGQKVGVSGIQFADNRPPTEDEKGYLRNEDFYYKVEENLWKREGKPGEPLGDNTIDATRVAAELARERDGLGR